MVQQIQRQILGLLVHDGFVLKIVLGKKKKYQNSSINLAMYLKEETTGNKSIESKVKNTEQP